MIVWLMMLFGWMVADVLWWRVADRAVRPLRRARVWRSLLGVFVVAQLAFMVMMFVGAIVDHVPLRGPLIWPVAAYIWHLFLLPGSVMLFLVYRGARRLRKKKAPEPVTGEPSTPPGITRRQLISAMAAGVPPLVTMGVGVAAVDRLGRFGVRDVDLHVPGLPDDLQGVTIAQVSDLHIGRFLPGGVAERVAEATNALRADLVIFTGDLLDVSCETVPPGIDFIRRLDPRHGLVMIQGNHDLMGGADRFEGQIRDAGLPLLLDETKVLRIPGRATPIQMMGITWGDLKRGSDLGRIGREARRWYRKPSKEHTEASIQHMMAQRQTDAFPILLAHHPHAFDPATAAGLPLVLSGHTHGGQLMLTHNIGVGPLRFRYWSGVYEKPGSRLFVNNGVGNWFPLRINAPAEIVKLTLRRA
jgi:predicted MPP superfamily phosphohydrolase